MPPIGFGTWQLHRQEAYEAVSLALGEGYRMIDTARIYLNEGAVGKAIRDSKIPREEIFVTTKLWNTSHGKIRAPRAFNASLRRLKMDYVDLYLIHWPMSKHRNETWKVLEKIQAEGKAKAIGVSNYTVRHLEELMSKSSVLPAVNQVEFHPFIYKEQIELLEFCENHGITLEAYSPLAHGHRMDDAVLIKIAKAHGKSVAQIMLRWAVEHGTVPIPKSTSRERMAENINIFDFKLSSQEIQSINELSDGLRTCWNPEAIE